MNELVTIGGALPLAPQVPQEAWGAEGAHQADLVVPRLQLLQDLSKPVKDGKARPGMILHSTTGQVLADKGQSLEIIPITTFREWLVSEVVGAKDKFVGRVPMTHLNEGWAKEEMVNGKLVRRTKAINFFVLLAGKMEEYKLPFLVSFKKTSIQAGRALSTHFQISAMKKPPRPPAAQVFNLSSQSRTWEGYDFFSFAIEQGRASTPAELEKAYEWYLTLSKQKVDIVEDSTDDIAF